MENKKKNKNGSMFCELCLAEEKIDCITQSEKQVISVHSDYDGLFNRFSPDKFNPEVLEYIEGEVRRLGKPGRHVKLEFTAKCEISEDERTAAGEALKNTVAESSNYEKKLAKQGTFIGSLLMLFAIFTMLLGVFLHIELDESGFLDIVFTVAVWVFIWEGIDTLILKPLAIRLRRHILAKIFCAEIVFLCKS